LARYFERVKMAKTMNLKTCLILAAIWAALPLTSAGKTIYVNPDVNGRIAIDHNCVDLSIIPDSYLPSAASLRALFRHASVGDGINWGLDCLAGLKPTNSSCSCYTPEKYDRSNWILENRGNPGSQQKVDDLVTQTQLRFTDFDVFMMKFCYIDALGDSHPDWDYYRTKMEQLEADYPNKKFVWWTIPLTRDGMPGTDWFNQKVRSYCAEHKKILFDIADIECYDPNGVKYTNAQGNEVICQDYTKEIHAGHLNVPGRIRVASAFWHLMARLAGWQRCTIQQTIDAASDGDTIIVADGTYTGPGNHDIDFKGKAITVRSENGPQNCIINCQGLGRGFHFHSGEDANSILAGFTITNGYADLGGGIYCDGSSPTLTNCRFSDNQASEDGGGMLNFGSNPTLTNCTFTGNSAGAVGGGGMFNMFSGPTLVNCTFAGNSASHQGGGICNDLYSDPTLINCVFTANSAHSIEAGGGIWTYWHSNPRLINCTLTGNLGGGIRSCYPQGDITTLTNCILWGNSPEISGPDFEVTYSDVHGGWPGEGNTDKDPCFAQPGYRDPNGTPEDANDDFWVDGDYHLKSQAGRWDANSTSWIKDDVTSPCIDAGNPASPIGLEPFPNGGTINMGAYGGTVEASKSYFGKPICETIVAGDINGDCIVNLKDFAIIAFHWLEEH